MPCVIHHRRRTRPGGVVLAQRHHLERLQPGQRRLLAGLGLAQIAEQPPGPGEPAARSWARGLAAARALHHREGHLNVPQRHIEILHGAPVRLGQWISNARRRKERLP
ncbi:Helicase associated domain protein [Streptomyces sp. R41]|uniref:Helicase associated domain protein n=1 Tax=Streptomyces sp. R41 TaxID=3238632 RepID=A0AB39R8N8_9ACTN